MFPLYNYCVTVESLYTCKDTFGTSVVLFLVSEETGTIAGVHYNTCIYMEGCLYFRGVPIEGFHLYIL